MTAPTDALLVALAAAGDEPAFEAIIRRYSALLTAFLCGRVRDIADAEDIIQETFIAAWPHLSGLRRPDRLGPWLMHIARNKLKDHYRARSRRPAIEMIPGGRDVEEDRLSRLAEPSPDPARQADMAQTRAIVTGAIAEFPDRYRLVLYLRLIDDAEPHEIAVRLAIKESTVRMRLKRGLEKLRVILVRRGIR